MIIQTALSIQTRLADKKLGIKDTLLISNQGALDHTVFAIGLIYSCKCAFTTNQKLVEDMPLLKPTFLTTVPFVLVNFFHHAGVFLGVNGHHLSTATFILSGNHKDLRNT